jgi:hypothetical protein
VIQLSRQLWNGLLAHDLVDELNLTIFPVIAGGAIPLFIGHPPVSLKLLSARTWADLGSILTICQPILREPMPEEQDPPPRVNQAHERRSPPSPATLTKRPGHRLAGGVTQPRLQGRIRSDHPETA